MNINKSILLNWLYSVNKELPIEELGQWITAKTNGQYVLTKNTNIEPHTQITS